MRPHDLTVLMLPAAAPGCAPRAIDLYGAYDPCASRISDRRIVCHMAG